MHLWEKSGDFQPSEGSFGEAYVHSTGAEGTESHPVMQPTEVAAPSHAVTNPPLVFVSHGS